MLSDWWNGVELWMLGLPFPFQFALVVVVLAPLCVAVAWLIDRIVDHASALFGPAKPAEPPLGAVRLEDTEVEKAEVAGTEVEHGAADEVVEATAEAGAAQPPAAGPARPERVPAESTRC